MTKLRYKNDPTDSYETEFDSIDLWECLEHYKETGNIEPLENAISINNGNIRRALEIVKELSNWAEPTDNSYLKNRLNNIKNLLR